MPLFTNVTIKMHVKYYFSHRLHYKEAKPTMTTNDITALAQTLTQATPSEAARIWTNVAGNKSLAIKVHEQLTHEQRLALAEKLTRAEKGKKIKGNDINHLV
jgi:predicted NAD-dependent protein-ADP-ribosyltransferase YbiA (DUF1768 family)